MIQRRAGETTQEKQINPGGSIGLAAASTHPILGAHDVERYRFEDYGA